MVGALDRGKVRRRAPVKRFVAMWARRRRRTRTITFRFDRALRVDGVINYFGERLAPAAIRARGRRKV
jgi:hypothetical protein